MSDLLQWIENEAARGLAEGDTISALTAIKWKIKDATLSNPAAADSNASAEARLREALDPLEMLLDAARYAEGNGSKYRNLAWAKAARAAVAKARLAAVSKDTGGSS